MNDFSELDADALALASSPVALLALSELNPRQLQGMLCRARLLERQLLLLERLPGLPTRGGLPKLHEFMDAAIDRAQNEHPVGTNFVVARMLQDWESDNVSVPLLQKLNLLGAIDKALIAALQAQIRHEVEGI